MLKPKPTDFDYFDGKCIVNAAELITKIVEGRKGDLSVRYLKSYFKNKGYFKTEFEWVLAWTCATMKIQLENKELLKK